jgi:hypothetical protein
MGIADAARSSKLARRKPIGFDSNREGSARRAVLD